TVVHFGRGNVDKVVGIEARGFILASPVAYHFGAGFIPVRKAGKLPYQVEAEEYALEYGSATLELHADAVVPGERVLIVDDVLATGGTARAAGRLGGRPGGPPGRAPGGQGHRHRHPDRARVPRRQEADRGLRVLQPHPVLRCRPRRASSPSTSWSRSPGDPATSTSSTTPPAASGSTGCCSARSTTRPTTASCPTPWPRTATPSTPWCCWVSRPSPAARSRPASSPCSTCPTTRAQTRSCWSSPRPLPTGTNSTRSTRHLRTCL